MSLSVSLTFHCNLSENLVRDTENANLCCKLHRKLQEGSTACPLPKSTLAIPQRKWKHKEGRNTPSALQIRTAQRFEGY